MLQTHDRTPRSGLRASASMNLVHGVLAHDNPNDPLSGTGTGSGTRRIGAGPTTDQRRVTDTPRRLSEHPTGRRRRCNPALNIGATAAPILEKAAWQGHGVPEAPYGGDGSGPHAAAIHVAASISTRPPALRAELVPALKAGLSLRTTTAISTAPRVVLPCLMDFPCRHRRITTTRTSARCAPPPSDATMYLELRAEAISWHPCCICQPRRSLCDYGLFSEHGAYR